MSNDWIFEKLRQYHRFLKANSLELAEQELLRLFPGLVPGLNSIQNDLDLVRKEYYGTTLYLHFSYDPYHKYGIPHLAIIKEKDKVLETYTIKKKLEGKSLIGLASLDPGKIYKRDIVQKANVGFWGTIDSYSHLTSLSNQTSFVEKIKNSSNRVFWRLRVDEVVKVEDKEDEP